MKSAATNHRWPILAFVVLLTATPLAATAAASPLRPCRFLGDDERYFPAFTLDPERTPAADADARSPEHQARLDELRELTRKHSRSAWYSRELAAMSEPSLSCGAPGEQYRFLWLRSFHPAVVVRVFREGDGWHLVAVENGRAVGHEPATTPVRRLHTWVSEARFAATRAAVRAAIAADAPDDLGGRDGALWIFEAVDADGWSVSDEWSPRTGAHREAGLAMLALADWSFADVY